MSSQRFFYFLSEPGKKLDFDRAITTLEEGDLVFDSELFINSLDESGGLVASEEARATGPLPAELARWLSESRSVQVMGRDQQLALTCTFGSPSGMFSINTGRRTWLNLPDEDREKYEGLLVRTANRAGAVLIMVVDDPPDDFWAKIQPVDRQWMVDMTLYQGVPMDPGTVLVRTDYGTPPAMRNLAPTNRMIDNFREYEERLPEARGRG
jgi:hypothetical protein